MESKVFRIGCAGWGVASGKAELFGAGDSVLERYSTRFPSVEINSSFTRAHQRRTYERWARSVPSGFRFTVKVPRTVTHAARLQGGDDPLLPFLDQVEGLGNTLGCLLVQLPPSLAFCPDVAPAFFAQLRHLSSVPVACEPRHPSWFTPEVDATLSEHRVGRVAADPAIVPAAAIPGGFPETLYYRWHGSPRTYYSGYSAEALQRLAEAVRATPAGYSPWIIFDNTAVGAALENAFELSALLGSSAQNRA
ncbi:DUF72 domain-containing protein [Deinococcus hopiensis]|uniref:DUF72 domain-containing protein n=1 Tax=Deinococcus hopiensis TaxID=309885 RepID=UPI001FE98674|nr:DUF72 domain-containing protein [Deinococcus hopiensis]